MHRRRFMRDMIMMGGTTKTMMEKILALSPDLYYPINDSAGSTVNEAMGKTSDTIELMTNGGFETHTGDDFDGWDENVAAGAIVAETTIVHGASMVSCKMTQANPTGAVYVVSPVCVVGHGQTLEIRIWTRGDGTNAGRYLIYDATHATALIGLTETGVTGTSWAEVVLNPATPAGSGDINIRVYLYAPAAASGVTYYDDVSLISKIYHSMVK